MKKFISIFLIVSLMLTLFAGCGKEKTSDDESDKKPSTTVGVNGEVNDDAPSVDANKIDLTKEIFKAQNFQNGIAIVTTVEAVDGRNIYTTNFIDKKGNIIYKSTELSLYANSVISKNGAVITSNEESIFNIREKKEVTAADLSGTEIIDIYNHPQYKSCFKDGYIFIQKTETTYDGNTKSMAIYSDTFELLYDYSTELYDFLENHSYNAQRFYHDGYIIYKEDYEEVYEEKYFDLNTMRFDTDHSKIDFETFRAEEIADETLFRSNKYPTMSQHTSFVDSTDGTAGITFNSEGVCYFTIVDMEGNFLFEPVQTKGVVVGGCNGQFTVLSYGEGEYIIEIFDTTGKKGEIKVAAPQQQFDTVTVYCNEGVIMFAGCYVFHNDIYYYYDMNGNKLF